MGVPGRLQRPFDRCARRDCENLLRAHAQALSLVGGQSDVLIRINPGRSIPPWLMLRVRFRDRRLWRAERRGRDGSDCGTLARGLLASLSHPRSIPGPRDFDIAVQYPTVRVFRCRGDNRGAGILDIRSGLFVSDSPEQEGFCRSAGQYR